MTWMGSRRLSLEDDQAYTEAWVDFLDRFSRRDPDMGFYMPGDPRPYVAWWRRLLRVSLPDR